MRTIFVGDVHGCAAEFAEILTATGYRHNQDRLLLTGDAFARGPDPLAVWHLIRETEAEMVLGNHDARLLQQFEACQSGHKPDVQKPDQHDTLAKLEPVREEIVTWLRQVPLYIEEAPFQLVHAGIDPQKGLSDTSRDQFLTIRTWPPTQEPIGPRWHASYQPQYPLLVFGHDALGGLVVKERDGRPYLLGLDTGCVYGNQLSAYILEEARLVQVPSQQPSLS